MWVQEHWSKLLYTGLFSDRMSKGTRWACSNVKRNLLCVVWFPEVTRWYPYPLVGYDESDCQSLMDITTVSTSTSLPVAGYKNGMTLCTTCHTIFNDMLNPGWIFIPADLAYSIKYRTKPEKRASKASKKPETATCQTASIFNPAEKDWRPAQLPLCLHLPGMQWAQSSGFFSAGHWQQ